MSALRVVFSDLVLAVLSFGSSVWLFCFGTDGFLVTIYGFFPLPMREYLWGLLPPERVTTSQDFSDMGALLLLATCFWFASDVWISYPRWRITMSIMLFAEGILLYQFLGKVFTILPF